ncbi:MAG: DUF86 domain-containing protein [Prevotellaceae bacterium]|jgi:uncharacterized protein with HEPN domain|nr:DUF86 domain-containing protein [Prevotellaceae bacterium]
MYDKELVAAILKQIEVALIKIQSRSANIHEAADFTNSPDGMEKLDGICMLFMAIGESVKNLDKITHGQLLSKYSEIDWLGVKGFRDIIAHHYFSIDAEQVYWIIKNKLEHIIVVVQKMIADL